MTTQMPHVNTVAPLTNVGLCLSLLEFIINRPSHVPGIGCFYGRPGLGKTTAATHLSARYQAYYVECKKVWNTKALLLNILKKMGLKEYFKKPMYEMLDAITEELANSRRPLIIDDVQHLTRKKSIDIIRDIYDGSDKSPVLLIGEQMLRNELKEFDTFDSRIGRYVEALPADLDDISHVARLYAPEIEIAEDLLKKIMKDSRGSLRRVGTAVEEVSEKAATLGATQISLKEWGSNSFFSE